MDLIKLDANYQDLSTIQRHCQIALQYTFSKLDEPVAKEAKRLNHLWSTCTAFMKYLCYLPLYITGLTYLIG